MRAGRWQSAASDTDDLSNAINAIDLPAAIADLFPSSGARAGHAGIIKGVWRGDKNPSVSLSNREGCWLWNDFATGQSGNAFQFFTEILGHSPANAAEELKRRAGLSGIEKPIRAVSASRVISAPTPTKVYAPLTDQQLEAIERNLEPIKAKSSAACDLERRGLPLADFSQVKRGDGKVKAGAVVITVRNHAGRVMNFKIRNPDPLEDAPRYVYLITGHGAPPDQQIDEGGAVLIVEGELNAARARMALEKIGLTFAVQGVAGGNGQPDLSRVARREVFIYADGDTVGVKAARVWSESALQAGAAVARVLQPLEGEQDFCDLTHDSLETWISEAISSAVGVTLEDATSGDADGFKWGQLGELAPALPSAASLPADMIPAALREWLEGAAATACVPLEVLTVPALIAASGVIGRSVVIHPRNFSDWTVAPNLWGAIVAPPGAMKSDMMGEALRPVSALEKTAREAHKAARLEADVEHDQLEAEYSGLKQKAKKGGDNKNAMLEIKQRLAALENIPEKRYTTQDATCEKLGELLRGNQRGMILTRDELASWIASMEREENAVARAFFLTSWNGTTPYKFDRIGRGTVDIPAMCVSVLGAIQPLPLRAVFSRLQEDETRSDGLLQRFQLFVYPDGLPAWQAPRSWPNPNARSAAGEVFKRLDTLERYDAETGDLEPRELRFSSDAQTVFDDWHDALEHRLRGVEDAKTPHFHSHISKYRSLAPSLAVVFHLLESAGHPHWRDWGQLEPVSLDALELALCWVEFLELHARKIYAPELNLSSVAAHALAKRIKDGSVTDAVTVRTLRRRDWSGLRGAALDAALTELESLNWVRLETVEARGDQGGAPSEIVRLHPDLLVGKA